MAELDLSQFRSMVREWLAMHLPASMRTPMPEDEMPWGGRKTRSPHPDTERWLQAMAAQGWTAPTWPREYGGAGLSADQAAVLREELARLQARPALFSFGLWMLGPVLLEFADEAQKRRFLPPIARGEIRWCQGYSEPGAGSDLASLKLRAVDHGDHWRVSGQKVWTSYADKSDWIFALVRTDPTAARHLGISFLLIDLATPGITVRPIHLISGSSPFCETFFDDVRVPKDQLVGPLNGGWAIAKRLLEHERQNVAAGGFGADRSVTNVQLARRVLGGGAGEPLGDPVLREQLAGQAMFEEALALCTRRVQRSLDAGGAGPMSSVIKIASARANQERAELAVEILGMDAMGWSGDAFAAAAVAESRKWLRSKGHSIEGGTTEINLNVVAKRVLGLPDQ